MCYWSTISSDFFSKLHFNLEAKNLVQNANLPNEYLTPFHIILLIFCLFLTFICSLLKQKGTLLLKINWFEISIFAQESYITSYASNFVVNTLLYYYIKFRSKHSSNTVVCLLRNLMHQTLFVWKFFFLSHIFEDSSE